MTRVPPRPLPPETIPFSFHPRVFAALGADLITNDSVAIIELVKNSYDAFATRVDVRFLEEDHHVCIEIEDNGDGMSRAVLETVWCVIATPHRLLERTRSRGRRKRPMAGEKGLGRLSAARLGDDLELFTRANDQPCWQLQVSWPALAKATTLSACGALLRRCGEPSPIRGTGTIVRIKALRSEWDETRIADLHEQLSRLVSPFSPTKDFRIWITTLGRAAQATEIEPAEFLAHPPYSFRGSVDREGALTATYRYSTAQGDREKGLAERLWPNTVETTERRTPACGPFAFELRAWDIGAESIQDIAERFDLKKSDVRDSIKAYAGISLYRDGILVLPKSDAARDWLGLNLRRVSRVGTRLSTNQMIGYVSITNQDNEGLRDTSDRERLVDNQATEDFRTFLTRAVELLEAERDKDRHDVRHKEPPFKDLFAALSAGDLVAGVSTLAQEGRPASEAVPLVEEYSAKIQETLGDIERRLVYYSRLASLGVLAAVLVHEVRNQTMILGRLVRVLRQEAAKTSVLSAVVPDLDLAERAIRSLERVADRFAPLASRAFGTRRRDSNLEEIISDCIAMREAEIKAKKVQITAPPEGRTLVGVDPGELVALIVNLLDNALYWLAYSKTPTEREIQFEVLRDASNQRVTVRVHDSGPGIEDSDEERIFWPGVTRKPEGLGMGLTVASEIVAQQGGRMHLIKPGKLGGASFGFDLPLSAKGT